jgi:uncharacterized membrane protein (UPF0182 family)
LSTTASQPQNRTRATIAIGAAILAVLVILFFIFASLYTEVLWFEQLGFQDVLFTEWIAGGVMFLMGFVAMAVPVWLSLQVAFRFRPVYAKLNAQLDRYQQVVEPLRRLAMFGIPAVLGVFAGVSASTRWQTALQFLHSTPFGETDPQFGLDVSFYVFQLPFLRSVVGFASAVVLLAGLGALATHYLYGGIRVNGREVRISKTARVQLAVTAGVYVLLQASSIWLDQYTTLFDPSAGFLPNGAGYTEANAVIWGRATVAIIAALIALLFLVTAVIGRWRLPLVGTALLVVSSLILGSVYPWIMQRFQVIPSEQSLEAPFIERNIEATRQAYGVGEIEEVPYNATTDAEPGALREDAETTANIRIVDPALVTDTFRQLEQVRQYYQFAPYLDVDRYTVDGATQDTVIALRELNQAGQSSGGWYNNTILYTHGFGVVAAYGNQRATDGEPVFMESGIPSTGVLTEELGDYEPRIYFGEASPEYSIVGGPEGAEPLELDYPSGGEETTGPRTTFAGDGGPLLDNVFKKLLYAIKFQSEQIFLSEAVTDQSQILYDRDPRDRVSKVAPYLTLDNDPYPAIVDDRIVWIVDGYTTSDNYPYSTVQQLSRTIADTYTPEPLYAVDDLNYIRNSVKATVDAYSGEVNLFAWDDEDPVLQTWQKIFPSSLQPMSEMGEELMSHVRYPADLFKVQRAILGDYHVTNANSFYEGEQAWITPNDPGSAETQQRLQPPYYLTMQVPGEDNPAFTLYSTFIPDATGAGARNVLTGYLAANSDPGEDYGKLTLLTLPGQNTVPGPGQVYNTFRSDTEVANQLALLERGNTQVSLGNLLTLPVGGGLLYVQPVYVQATGGTSYPLLRKVLVSFGNEIAFEDTLDEALDTLFGGDSGADAGDEGVEPTDPQTPPAEEPTDGEEPATPTPTPTEPGDALADALADAQQALQDRTAAYAENDLVAAAEADRRLQDAVERAIAASE